MTWASIARAVFRGARPRCSSVRGVTTTEYGAGKSLAPRPRNSMLSLDKIIGSGFQPADATTQLAAYLATVH